MNSTLRRFAVLLVVLGAVIFPPALLAQEADVRVVPVLGDLFGYEMSADGRYVAIHENGTIHSDEVLPGYLPVRVYDLETGELAARLEGSSDYLTDVAFSPDGGKLAGYIVPGMLYVWDVETGALERELPVAPSGGYVEFLADGRTVAVTQTQPVTAFQLWDIETGFMTAQHMQRYSSWGEMREAREEVFPRDMPAAITIAPDRMDIALATFSGDIQLWNMETGDVRLLRNFAGEDPVAAIRAMAFSVDGATLYYLENREDYVGVIDVASSRETAQIPVGDTLPLAFAVSPDETTLALMTTYPDGGDPSLILLPVDSPSDAVQVPLPLTEHSLRRGQEIARFTPEGNVLVSGFHIRAGVADPATPNAIFVVTP